MTDMAGQRGIYIPVDPAEPIRIVDIKDRADLRQLVQGLPERTQYDYDAIMVVNDTGRINGMAAAINPRATDYILNHSAVAERNKVRGSAPPPGYGLYGPVVVVGQDRHGETVDVPDRLVTHFEPRMERDVAEPAHLLDRSEEPFSHVNLYGYVDHDGQQGWSTNDGGDIDVGLWKEGGRWKAAVNPLHGDVISYDLGQVAGPREALDELNRQVSWERTPALAFDRDVLDIMKKQSERLFDRDMTYGRMSAEYHQYQEKYNQVADHVFTQLIVQGVSDQATEILRDHEGAIDTELAQRYEQMQRGPEAERRADALRQEYFRLETLNNTPMSYTYGIDEEGYDDRYPDYDTGPIEAELDAHLAAHPELEALPEWASYYQGLAERIEAFDRDRFDDYGRGR